MSLVAATPSNFNPRTLVGCDYDVIVDGMTARISIHAPSWGATSGRFPP